MKSVNIQYLKLVTQAKSILVDIENSKLDIAELAIKACTIKLGGHITGFYSVTNFADDIGVNRKTLSAWIHNRKIQKTLKKSKINVDNETQLNNIRKALGVEKGANTGLTKVNKYEDKERVLRAKALADSKSQEDRELDYMLKRLQTINFQLRTFDLKKLDSNKLTVLSNLMTECVCNITKRGK